MSEPDITFTVTLETDGKMHLDGVPDDEALTRALAEAIAHQHPFGDVWASRYRAYQPMMGSSQDVPHWRRLKGELQGQELRLTGGEISHDGQTWTEFPLHAPRYQVTHWQEGRIDVEPDPLDDDLDAIEDAARALHGERLNDWTDAHRKLQPVGEVPVARRSLFERGDDGIYHPQPEHAAYSLDGEEWVAYDPSTDLIEAADDPFAALEQMFGGMLDVDTVPVNVYADGRVEWDDGDIPAEHAGRIIADLRQATGAGNTDAWAAWTNDLLNQTFAAELHVPEGATLPVPLGVRLDLPQDAIADPDPLAQTFMESEVTFDGVTWRDLFSEEVPEELAAFRAGQGGN